MAERTIIIPQQRDPETGEPLGYVDRDRALVTLEDLEGALFQLGGVVHIAAQRVKDHEVGGKPVYRTVGYFIQWDSYAPALPAREPDELEDEPLEEEVDVESALAAAAGDELDLTPED